MSSLEELNALYRDALTRAEGESANEGSEHRDPDTWLLARGWWGCPRSCSGGGQDYIGCGGCPYPEDFGAAGNGTTDDTAAFVALEKKYTGIRINLRGRYYKVSTPPCKNYYYNGWWNYNTDYAGEGGGGTGPAWDDNIFMEFGSVHSSGSGTTGRNYVVLNDSPTTDAWKTNLKNVVAIGENTLTAAIEAHNDYVSDFIAIGRGVMSEDAMVGNKGHNIGVGQHALHNLVSGHRNIAIGSLAMQFSTTAGKSIAIGRDAGQTLMQGAQNVLIGYKALCGLGYSAGSTYLEPQNAVQANYCTVVGAQTAKWLSGSPRRTTIIGAGTLIRAKRTTNSTIVGSHTANHVGADRSVNGKGYINYGSSTVEADTEATYSVVGNVLTLTPEDNSFLASVGAGNMLSAEVPGIEVDEFVVLSVTATKVTVDVGSDEYDGRYGTGAYIDSVSTGKKGSYTTSSDNGTYYATITPLDSAIATAAEVGNYIYCKIPGIGNNLLYVISKTSTTITVELTGGAINGNESPDGVNDVLIRGVEVTLGDGEPEHRVNRSVLMGEMQFNKALGIGSSTTVGSQIAGAATSEGTFGNLEAFGYCAGHKLNEGEDSVLIGSYAAGSATKTMDSVVIGPWAGYLATVPRNSVIIGESSGVAGGMSYNNVLVGCEAGKAGTGSSDTTDPNTKCRRNTAVGFQAMKYFISGDNLVTGADAANMTVRDSTAIGSNAYVSGSEQVQLGGSGTTPYAYAALQVRSDARDKTNIRDTQLGLDFINTLRPRDFIWDVREDYWDEEQYEEMVTDAEGQMRTVTRTRKVQAEKDGSRKRVRYHHGFIAQEVKAALDEAGIDFGGYQDHKVNGGGDVLSLGYGEFVAPMVKAIQELDARLKVLEG